MFDGYHTLSLINPTKFDSVGLQILGDTEQWWHIVYSSLKMRSLSSAWKTSPVLRDRLSQSHTLMQRCAGESLWWSRRKGKRTGAFSWLSVHSATQVVPDAPVTLAREVEK